MTSPTLNGEIMFPSMYLSNEDLKGKDVTVTIESVTIDEVFMKDAGGKQKAKMISFVGKKKKLILNKTNASLIAQATGITEARDWPGHKIIVYPTTCQFRKDPNHPCIRVRPTAPKSKPKQNAPVSDPVLDMLWQLAKADPISVTTIDQMWIVADPDNQVEPTDAQTELEANEDWPGLAQFIINLYKVKAKLNEI